MPYIGKTPTVGNFQVCDAISVVNGQAAYTLQVGGVNVAPESANHMLVSLNGILQKPGSSFTISGSTMTFASNLATGDVIDFVQILGNVLDLGQPSDNTVTAAKLATTSITGQTAETSVADDDTVLLHDTSASALRKMTVSNLVANAGGGKLLQIVQAQFSTAMSTSAGNSSPADTGLTANITPSATSSKVLIFVTHPHVRKSGDTQLDFQLVRDSTVVYDNIGNFDTGDTQQIHTVVAFQYLDSPSTTSQVTYKTRMAAGNGYLYAQSGSSNIILCEIGA